MMNRLGAIEFTRTFTLLSGPDFELWLLKVLWAR